MRRFLPLLFFVSSITTLSLAQSGNRAEIFGGYSYINQDTSLSNPLGNSGVNGWNASANFALKPSLGIVADFSGFYPSYNPGCQGNCSSTANIYTFLFGPQVSMTRGRWKPFARFLIGDMHMTTQLGGVESTTFTTNDSLTFGLGGGIDYSLTHRLALRGQVDWLHNGFKTTDSSLANDEIHNVARISTGVVFRF